MQSFIPNGLVRINSRRLRRENKFNSSEMYLDLIQGDSIRYECQKGFFLQKINSNENFQHTYKTIKCRANEKISESGEYEPILYECVQYCEQPKFNSTLINGFLVPARNFYKPGEQIGYYCKDGYASKIYFYQENNLTSLINNLQRLKCVRDGSWHYISDDNTNLTKFHILRDSYLPLCQNLDVFFSENIDQKDKINHKDLNIRSMSLVFSLVGLIIGLLCVSLVSIRTMRTRNSVPYATLSNGSTRINSIASNIGASRPSLSIMPVHTAILRSTPQSNSLGSPPSYDQLFTNTPQSCANNLADASCIDFRVNLNLSRPNSSIAVRNRTNRVDMSRKSKSSAMRKKIIDKRRKTNSQNEACSSNQC